MIEMRAAAPSKAEVARCILRLLRARDGKTICPSEVARAFDPKDFRALMPAVREAAAALLVRGRIRVTQRGQPVEPLTARGAIRFAPVMESAGKRQ
jgi:hypothetical protein